MAVFFRPARVVVDEGGGGWPLAVLAVAVVAAVAAALSAVLATILTVVLVSLLLLAAAGTVALVVVLRRDRAGLYAPQKAAPPVAVRSPVLAASSPAAIEGTPPVVVPGIVLDNDRKAER